MINLNKFVEVSPILLTVLLIAYLLLIEFGDSKTKKILLPFVIVLIIVFLIVAVTNISTTYFALGK